MASPLATYDFVEKEPIARPARRPKTIVETGVRQHVLEDLTLKILYLAGTLSIAEIATRTHLPYEVADEIFSRLRAGQFCQVTGMSGNIPLIAITSQGRSRAIELLSQSHYVGPAPVSLRDYVEQTRLQSVRNVEVRPPDVERGFADLVIDSKMLRQFGTALNSGSSVFLYGPPGVGKTSIAERLSRVLAKDAVWIPHSIEVDGEVIAVFDPEIHKTAAEEGLENCDARWARCHRPTVMVGGELTVEMLDLRFNPLTKFYVAPQQMKANNGVLIIDDFGRQRIRPEELLNRWVVPLDRRIDFLTLTGGRKIEIPFEMLVVFASNMDPAELVDPSFLRRIQTKIRVGEVSSEQFREISRRVATLNHLEYDAGIFDDLIQYVRVSLNQELRPCFPRDIVNQVLWAAKYDGRKPHLNRATLATAIEAYFLPRPQ